MKHNPINDRIPVEISSLIFQFCCLEYDREVVSGSKNPLTLSAVCRYWRMVAFSTPRLWCSIALAISYYQKTPLLLAQEWLDRSGTLPLYISFHVDYDIDLEEIGCLEEITDIIRMLNAYAPRWKELDFTVPAELLHIFCCDSHSAAPILSALSLRTIDTNSGEAIKFDIGALPNLTKLIITDTYLDWINIDLCNLTEFACNTAINSEILQILEGAQRIEIVKVERLFEMDDENEPPPVVTPIISQHLREFHVEEHRPSLSFDFWGMRDFWTMPSLRSLAIYFDSNLTRQSHLPFFLQQPSIDNLTTLQVSGDKGNYHHVYNLLRCLINLENFKTSWMALPDEFFLKMYDTAHIGVTPVVNINDNPPFLPRLRTFVYNDGTRAAAWSCLHFLLTSATGDSSRGRPLKEVVLVDYITSYETLDKRYKATQCIRDARERGVVVRLSDDSKTWTIDI